MKALPVKLIYGQGYEPCAIEDATHLTLNIPGPTGLLTLPVILSGTRSGTGRWTWNGSTDAPTLRPSVLTQGHNFRCHSWINDGAAQFLDDCSHELKGQTVPLLDAARAPADSQPVPVVDRCTKQQMTAEVLRRMQQQEDGHNKNPFRSLLDRLMRNEGGYSTIEIGQLKYALDGFYGAARAPADSVTAPAYSIDADPQGIRARVADAITGALAFGAQGANPPPTGHWLVPFWETAREEASRNRPVSSDTLYLLRRLLSNQHTLTSAEFREELTKIVGEAAQAEDSVLEDAADPLQGAANWLAEAHGQFSPVVLSGCLMIGYNRAKRLHEAALAARKQGANHD